MSTHKSSRNLFFFYAVISSFSVTKGIFLVYMANRGLTVWQIAMYQTLYFFSTSILEVPTGYFGDKHGKKKSMLFGTIILSLHSVSMIFSNEFHQFWLLAVLEAFGYSLISGSDSALFYELLTEDDLGEKYLVKNSQLLSIKSLITGISILVGGVLSSLSWTLLYCISASVHAISAGLITFLSSKSERVNEDVSIKGLFKSINSRSITIYKYSDIFILFVIMSSLMDGFFMTYYNFNQIIFSELKIDTTLIGLFFSIVYFLKSGSYMIGMGISKKANCKILFVFLLFIQSLFFMSMYFIPSNYFIMIITAIVLIIPEILFLFSDQFIQNNIINSYRASTLSIVSLFRSVSSGFFYSIFGSLLLLITIQGLFLGISTLIILSAIFSFLIYRFIINRNINESTS